MQFPREAGRIFVLAIYNQWVSLWYGISVPKSLSAASAKMMAAAFVPSYCGHRHDPTEPLRQERGMDSTRGSMVGGLL